MWTPSDLFPLKVDNPYPFSEINCGEVFYVDGDRYKLLSRTAFSVKLLQWFAVHDLIYRLLGRKVVYSRETIRELYNQ